MAWKPEYAGKRLRCKCGFAMVGPPAPSASISAPPKKAAAASSAAAAPTAAGVASRGATAVAQAPKPASPPPAAAASEADPFESLVAQAEEYALAEEAAQPKEKPKPAARRPNAVTAARRPGGGGGGGVAAAAALPSPASPMLAYARAVPRKQDDGAKDAMVHDLFVPLGLIVVGVLARFLDAYIRGVHNPALMTVFVVVTCTINLILVFSALMIAVKVLNLGLGNLGPAMLKIVAVALLPSAVGDMVRFYTFGLICWTATAVMYYLLLYYLFDLDGMEMRIVTAIIWLMQTWVGLLILGLLFSSMGIGLRSGVGVSAGGTNTRATQLLMLSSRSSRDKPPPPSPDQIAADEIRDGNAVEFTKWIKPDLHGVLRGTRQEALDQADKFYAAGAKSVWAMKIEKRGTMEICHEMVVELPDSAAGKKAVRKAIYGFDTSQFPSAPADEGDPNEGKRFIHLPLD